MLCLHESLLLSFAPLNIHHLPHVRHPLYHDFLFFISILRLLFLSIIARNYSILYLFSDSAGWADGSDARNSAVSRELRAAAADRFRETEDAIAHSSWFARVNFVWQIDFSRLLMISTRLLAFVWSPLWTQISCSLFAVRVFNFAFLPFLQPVSRFCPRFCVLCEHTVLNSESTPTARHVSMPRKYVIFFTNVCWYSARDFTRRPAL
jgi:hypothetical protein